MNGCFYVDLRFALGRTFFRVGRLRSDINSSARVLLRVASRGEVHFYVVESSNFRLTRPRRGIALDMAVS